MGTGGSQRDRQQFANQCIFNLYSCITALNQYYLIITTSLHLTEKFDFDLCVCMKEPGECFDLIPLQPFQLVSVHLWPLITAASIIHHCMYTRFSHYHRLPSFSSRWKLPVCLSPWATALARELCCVYSYIACIMEGGNLNEGTVRVSCCPTG